VLVWVGVEFGRAEERDPEHRLLLIHVPRDEHLLVRSGEPRPVPSLIGVNESRVVHDADHGVRGAANGFRGVHGLAELVLVA